MLGGVEAKVHGGKLSVKVLRMKPVYVRPEGGEGVKRPTCYVCGCPRCGEYPLAVRQQATGPYFPFLETHEPPDGSEPPSSDGRILSCFLCYSYLTQQWQLYERDKVPPVKRIYWLKRVDNGPFTGVEVGVQSEYASQLLGLAPDPPSQPSEVKRAGSASGSVRSHPQPPQAPLSLPLPLPPPTTMHQPSPAMEVKKARVNAPQPQPPSVPLPPPGVPLLPIGMPLPQLSTQQEALDLSLEGRRGIKREREEELQTQDPGSIAPRTEVLDLRMPDKNATTEVCYVCGEHYKKGTLVDIYAKQQNENCPFFPSLMLHPRPSKSHPMEASGRVQGCWDCFRHMQTQWDAYETRKIPHAERFYSLRKKAIPVVDDSTAFVCYKCGQECPSSSLCLVYCRPNSDKEPFYPFIEKLCPPEGASPISPQGLVQVCSPCFKAIPQQQKEILGREENASSNNVLPVRLADRNTEQCGGSSSPVGHTQPGPSSSMTIADGDSLLDEATCYLCHQNHSRQTMHWLAMVAESSKQDGMYFSFLKYLPRIAQNSVVENGRVLACSPCHQHLSNQWTEYEKDKVSEEHRQFSLRAIPTNSMSPRLTPGPTISSPGVSPTNGSPTHSFSIVAEAHLKSSTEGKKVTSSYTGQPLHTLEVVPACPDPGTPTLSVITTQKALNLAANCFVCSFHSKPGQTYSLRSKPHGSEPFFPFLAKHQSAHPEARIDDSCVLTCLCCFHSLILQWQRYEKEKVAHYARLYDTYNYMCFICSLKTYRKRLYLLPVKDYPFLKDHNRPPGGMVVDNGHSVVVCKDCYSSLKNQYIELERWGVPVEKRQYNWIQRPPPPEFQHGTSAKSIQVFTSSTLPMVVEPGSSSPGSQLGNSPGALQQPGGGSPRGSHGPTLGSSSAMGDGSGLHPNAALKQNEELMLPANSALPKSTSNTSATEDSNEITGGNIPSCYAPLPLQVGIARQGGTQCNNFVKEHSVAPSEGLNSGDTKEIKHTEQKLPKMDQLTNNLSSPSVAKTDNMGHESSSQDKVYQLEDQDKIVYKKRRSVIRGLTSSAVVAKSGNSSVSMSTNSSSSSSSSSPQIPRSPCTQLLATSPELQTKCS
ncbi:uncharacterized protein LOC126980729 isoform X3 [Eriocheir sinensis]|uniref:uncharacterized protein LOC126980729 isoform X3 n=1 Tax=Eriocheir sinensis TaxID=95602 RepID=UPI0021CA3DC3|nr:uncharacterized protein LOC126980729 isoform X3 [Eriocheir sinensis]